MLIPYDFWDRCSHPEGESHRYENGFIVLVHPDWYMSDQRAADRELADRGLELGVNSLLFFQKREDWDRFSLTDGELLENGKSFTPAESRTAPLGGTYVARVIASTARDSQKVNLGFTTKKIRGAGIRVYEYSPQRYILGARVQLEALIWMCVGAIEVMPIHGMSELDAAIRRDAIMALAHKNELLEMARLRKARLVNGNGNTICPLCAEEIDPEDFFRREEQAEGRATWNLTSTQLSLFHVEELRMGALQHKPYNLGWGHHHCNTVAKDAGIVPTLRWMKTVVERNLSEVSTIEELDQSVEEGVKG